MKTTDELLAIKMTIKTLSVKVKRIENVNKMLKKKLSDFDDTDSDDNRVSENNNKRKISYLDRFHSEERVRNGISFE